MNLKHCVLLIPNVPTVVFYCFVAFLNALIARVDESAKHVFEGVLLSIMHFQIQWLLDCHPRW